MRFSMPRLMRDMGQGINAFKKGLKEETNKDTDSAESEKPSIEEGAVAASAAVEEKDTKAVNG